jgi:hypothetical protein
MKRLLTISLLLMLPAWAAPAPAQGFFSKRARPNPNQRVPELIYMIKSDSDERKRANAAEELQNYDARNYSEIVPVLLDVAQNDPRPSVRQEALNSLGRLRPVNPAVGQVLERAASHDDSWRVRLQAKSALMKYHMAGYSSAAKAETAGTPPSRNVTTAEPPLAEPPVTVPTPAQAAPRAATIPAQAPRPQQVSPPTFGTLVARPQPMQAPATPPPAPITIEVEGPALTPQR